MSLILCTILYNFTLCDYRFKTIEKEVHDSEEDEEVEGQAGM